MSTIERLLRVNEVCDRIGLSRATIYRLERRGVFPARVRVTQCAVRWPETSITEWIDDRKALRRAA